MSNDELTGRTAHELSADLVAGRLTSAVVVRAFLDRIERHDAALRAFVSVHGDDALRAAQAADAAIAAGQRLGPFHGLPIAIKDIVDIEGRVTTGGSRVWQHRVSPHTATLVRRLIGAGVIVIGKTHSVEFAMGSFGTNTHMGSPRNPWDRQVVRAPGGSSSGTAVAVAAGFAPWGIGTDTGGSIRVPSAWCGLTGLKTTLGRISVHGVLPLAQSLDTPGPMCRDVQDAALLYALLQGPDPLDPLTLRHPPDDPLPTLRRGVDGLVLARLPQAERSAVQPDMLAAYDESLARLQRLGARLVERTLPRGFADLGALAGRLIGCEGYANVGHLVDDPSLPIDPDVRPRILLGRGVAARDYLLLLREVAALKRDWAAALEGCDALLTPTAAGPAPALTEIDQGGTAATYTRAINLVEGCALALPNGFAPAAAGGGLPLSLQVACGPHQEAMALRIGQALQQDTDWHQRRATLQD